MTSNQQKLDTPMIENQYNKSSSEYSPPEITIPGNYRTIAALRKGQQQNQEEEDENQFDLKINEEAWQKLKKISESLRLATNIVLESAINYACFYVKKNKIPLEKITQVEGFPQKNHNNFKIKKLELSVITQNSLNELNLQDKPSECAIFGINLLYQNNCQFNNIENQDSSN